MKIISDKIYGRVEIKEPILLELLSAPSILRLEKISQFGIPDKYYHFKNFSRYEHSVGVMLLLRKLGAGLEEQIAGLIHDVSTLAFSHITDWVFAQGSQGDESFHDGFHQEFVRRTEIPQILEKFDLAPEMVLGHKNFTLLEKEIPDLCADRIDYALREFENWFNPGIVQSCFEALHNFNQEIVFTDTKKAFDFASGFLELQLKHWGSPETVKRYYFFAHILKSALAQQLIFKDDFYQDEETILGKIQKANNKSISDNLISMTAADFGLNQGKKVFKKFRYVDPQILLNSKLIRLTAAKPDFKELLERHREINKQGVIV